MTGMSNAESVQVRSLAASKQTAVRIKELESAEHSLQLAGRAIDTGATDRAAQLLSKSIAHFEMAGEQQKASQIATFLLQIQA
jgi:hypothetical protein